MLSYLARRCVVGVAGAVIVGLFTPTANAESSLDPTPSSYAAAADLFANGVRGISGLDESEWLDFSVLGYARSTHSRITPAVQWVPQSLPAVDGFNAKIDGYGGGASHTHGFYGTNGSFALPLAQQWGAQIDGGVGSFAGSGTARGAGHFFWRDPSIGLLGAYGSYSRWNGIGGEIIPRTALSIARYAAEGEYYLGRWTIGGLAGYESVRFNIPAIGNQHRHNHRI